MSIYACVLDCLTSASPSSSSCLDVPVWAVVHLRHVLDGGYQHSRHCQLHLQWRSDDGRRLLLGLRSHNSYGWRTVDSCTQYSPTITPARDTGVACELTVNGVWSIWSACSASCGVGTQTRTQ